MEGAIDSSYIVGPGDYFEILLPKGMDVVQVSPEGSVSVPGCGIVKVDSLPLSQAKAAIMGLLLTKYEERFVQVQIVKMRRVHVSVLGAVNAPGFRAIDPQTRLSTMIGYVNGFKPLADKKNMKLIRNKDTLNIDFTKYEMDGVAREQRRRIRALRDIEPDDYHQHPEGVGDDFSCGGKDLR